MKLKIIRNADLFTPEHKGMSDILIAGEKIAMTAPKIEITGVPFDTVDVGGLKVVPGFIDRHVHVIGGGGQQGYASLVPEVTVSELVSCGTTTVVGLLGTDGCVKNLQALYAKIKAISQEGLSAYMLTGFYGLPTRTMTGSVAEDLIFIDKCIGCKVAMSDDRSSFPTKLDLLRLINEVRLGGFTSGKGGFLHIHLGNLPGGIQLLIDIASEVPSLIKYISPTHMIRTEELFRQAVAFAKMGGNVDFSTGGTRFDLPHKCVMKALEQGVNLGRITFSSDGHGGVRRVDPETGEVTYRPAPMQLNWKEVAALVTDCQLPLEKALMPITINPARQMNLKTKGEIADGMDADLCVIDDHYRIVGVVARGEVAMREGTTTLKGRYEA